MASPISAVPPSGAGSAHALWIRAAASASPRNSSIIVPDTTAAVLSAAMMLEFLGEADAAARIHKACADPAPEGGTAEIGDAIAEGV